MQYKNSFNEYNPGKIDTGRPRLVVYHSYSVESIDGVINAALVAHNQSKRFVFEPAAVD
jgi:hypothetical protein